MPKIRALTEEEEKILRDNRMEPLNEKGAGNFGVMSREEDSIRMLNYKTGCTIEITRGLKPW